MNVHEVTLIRNTSTDQGRVGYVFINGAKFGRSIELPWKDNTPDMSCIPAGKYSCTWHMSPRFGWVYKVHDVPGRSDILFHAGNIAGDTDVGFKTDSKGCILLGQDVGVVYGQMAVLNSKATTSAFSIALKCSEFNLTIIDKESVYYVK